jgi:hypothetical protein
MRQSHLSAVNESQSLCISVSSAQSKYDQSCYNTLGVHMKFQSIDYESSFSFTYYFIIKARLNFIYYGNNADLKSNLEIPLAGVQSALI